MSIAIDTTCLQCHLERNLELARTLGDEEKAMAFAKELMKMYLSAPEGISSPWFTPQTADLFLEHYGLPLDRYRQEKLDSNRFVLERLDQIRGPGAGGAAAGDFGKLSGFLCAPGPGQL